MAGKRERREQERREKQRQRRVRAVASRKARGERQRAGAARAAQWPVADAFVSEHWHAWETTIHGVFTRAHADGTHAYAAFEVDLADEGLRNVVVEIGVDAGRVQSAAVERSQEHALVFAEPAAVARLAQDGLAFRRSRGLPDPEGLSAALALLDGVDPDDSPFDYHFGCEDEEEDTVEIPVQRGLLGRILRVFGR